MAYGQFHSILTNAQLPAPNTGTPGDVFWVNATGLLWFIEGSGNPIQLLNAVPVPTIGPQGPQGNPGPVGPQGPALFFQGNWQGSPVEYAQGSLVTYNGNLWLANAVSNIANPPPSNPFWTLLGALPSQVSELVIAVDGAGQTPGLGFHGYLSIPYNCTINGWVLFADQQGSASFDVKWTPFSGFPVTTSIVGSANPKLTAQQSNETLDVSALWTKLSFIKGDVLEFDLLSATSITFLTLVLNITSD